MILREGRPLPYNAGRRGAVPYQGSLWEGAPVEDGWRSKQLFVICNQLSEIETNYVQSMTPSVKTSGFATSLKEGGLIRYPNSKQT